MRLTGLSGGNLTWAIRRGVNGATLAAHLTSAAVTAVVPITRMFTSTVAGLTGKCYLGTAALNKATFAGVVKEFWPTGSGGGVDDTFSLPPVERERYNLTDFWIDVAVSGEGLTISGTVAPL